VSLPSFRFRVGVGASSLIQGAGWGAGVIPLSHLWPDRPQNFSFAVQFLLADIILSTPEAAIFQHSLLQLQASWHQDDLTRSFVILEIEKLDVRKTVVKKTKGDSDN